MLVLQISVTAASSVKHPLEPPDTSSPQATLITFVENFNKGYDLLMESYDQYLKEPLIVRFVKYGDYSLDVEIFVYVNTGNIFEFLEIQEDVLLRVKDIVETPGTELAFPSQRNYLSRDSGIDQERSRSAEAEVQAWRSKGVLPFPEFPPEQ